MTKIAIITGMCRSLRAVLVCGALAACGGGAVEPDAGVSIGSGGPAARAGVDTGAARAGVSTAGVYAQADVVKAGPASVSVGTGGVSGRVDLGPVSVGVGSGSWWRLGLGL